MTVLRGLVTSAEVAVIERGIERNLADPAPLVTVASKAEHPGRFVEGFGTWQRSEEFRQIPFESCSSTARVRSWPAPGSPACHA